MGQSRRRLTADNGRRLVNKSVVGERLDHEEREIDAPGQVAFENRIAHMAAPERKPLALALFQIAAAHHRPFFVAGEDAPAGFHLIADIHHTQHFRDPRDDGEDKFEAL